MHRPTISRELSFSYILYCVFSVILNLEQTEPRKKLYCILKDFASVHEFSHCSWRYVEDDRNVQCSLI